MRRASAPKLATDGAFSIRVRITPEQLKEISRRASLGPFDGLARSEYIVGSAFGEPRDELPGRVLQNRDAERARLRVEIEDARR